MATLDDPSILCKAGPANALLGISKAVEDNCAVITRKRGVEIVNLVDQKCVAMWSVEMDSMLTAACVCCSTSYYSVRDNQNILHWTADSPSFQSPISASLPIFGLHFVHGVSEPIVVLINGAVNLASQCSTARETRHHRMRRESKYDCSFIASDACEWKTGDMVGVVVTVKKLRNGSLHFAFYRVTESVCAPWLESDMGVSLDPCLFQNICLNSCVDGHLEIVSVWNDSTLWLQCLSADGSFLTSPLQIIQFGQSNLSEIDKVSVCPLGFSRYAVLEMRQSTEGDECCIYIVNTKYKTVSATVAFHCSQATEEDSDKPQQCQIRWIGNFLVALCNSTVFVTHYETQAPLLSAVVGQHGSAVSQLTKPPIALSASTWLTSVSEEEKMPECELWYEELFDDQKTPNVKAFDIKYSAKSGTGKLEVSTKRPKRQKKVVHTSDEEQELAVKQLDITVGQYILMQTVSRCLSDPTFWPHQSLLDMIERFSLPSSCSLDLLSLSIKHDDIAIVTAALLKSQDVDETAIVQCLEYVLRIDETSSAARTGSVTKALGEKHLLWIILGKPRNDFLIRSSLKLLSYSQVKILMKLLSSVLSTKSRLCNTTQDDCEEVVISEADAAEWIALLIDAHFAQLMLDPEAKQLLLRLYKEVSHQVRFCERLNVVDGLLAHLANSGGGERRKQYNQYTVELMDL